jgi:hypothetical protein
MLVLSCIPCSDADSFAMQHNQTNVTAKTSTGHSRSSDQEHKDLCSPFCQCSCCALAYALPTAIAQEVVIRAVVSDKVFASYLHQRIVGIAFPVWQPPQLV